ncbi:MAG: family 78 glycoside hydrolase catalytic domain [Prolixibacteraceae bacterium]|nr:family 78 glycoside hydrolase catalytic domain [Prolixibacteraceae bacterium]
MNNLTKTIVTYLKILIVGFIWVSANILPCHSQDYSDVTIYETKLNQENNPFGIDNENPEFSWKLKSEKRNRSQKAYQIAVWSENTTDTCWNSGKVISDNNILVKYAGKTLKSVNSYTWKVRIWDNDGKLSSWSKENHFSTGLLSEEDWKADWISTPDSAYSPVFIKEFRIDKIPELANVFVNCQGYFELYINGEKVGNDVLSPAVSDFQLENYYLTYTIRDYLKIGENTIGIWTGRGWYSYGLPGVFHKSPVFRLQAHLSSSNGTAVIVSDTTWTTFNSNIFQIGKWRWNQMGGELIDSRIPMSEWKIDKIEKNKKNTIRVPKPQATTKSQICRPNIISDTILVNTISQIEKDVWLVDFGKNFTGWMKMKIKNQNPGDTIDFIYSDFCNKKPERIGKYRWDFGNDYIDQRDAYICSTSDSGIFCPKFNFHAFRYVIIQGLNYQPQALDIEGYMIESDLTEAGSFSSSDKDLNAIYELNRFTFRCLDIGGYYVDCPHRERLGYGDGQVAVETGIYNFELANFYKKWALNWISAQKPDGEIPNTAPSPYGAGGGPGWGGTGVVLPWKMYKYYGDTTLLGSSYNSMVRYVDFLETKSKDGILMHYGDETWGFIGDWVPPGKGMDSNDKVGKTEKEVFNNCYKIYLYNILAECAEVLGKPNDSQKYKRQSETLKNKIHELYYNEEKGIYANGEQSYLAFPLLMNVPAKVDRDRVLSNLENDIKITNNGHLNTGMLGTYFMLQYLVEIGRSDLVYLMMKQNTYPGWGYMVSQGANTCWEQWNGYWSNIHSCFTSGGGWFYTGIAGIRQMEKSVAFKHLLIAPQLTDVIKEQKSVFNSPYGKVGVSWTHKENVSLQIEVEIPANSKADVILPVSANQIVYESGRNMNEVSDIKILSRQADQLRLFVTSGKYIFEIRNK